MKKETFYFSHDFGARNDPKLQRLIVELGAAGLGAYWCLVEQLYEQGGILPMYVCKSTAFALHLETGVVNSIIKDFDLFESDGDSFWSKSVNERLGRRKEITEARKEAAKKRWELRQKMQEQSNSNANALQNDANKIKVKESKEKEIKENSSTDVDDKIKEERKIKKKEEKELLQEAKAVFDRFRQSYPGKKRGLETEFENFIKKVKDWRDVIPLLEAAGARYAQETSGQPKHYIKHLQTWINNRCWEEIDTNTDNDYNGNRTHRQNSVPPAEYGIKV